MCVDLTRVSATHPAMALLRAPIVIIEPTAVHSHSLILLHGAAHMLPAETRSLREILLVETRSFVRLVRRHALRRPDVSALAAAADGARWQRVGHALHLPVVAGPDHLLASRT